MKSRHIISILSLLVIEIHMVLRKNLALMHSISTRLLAPLRRALSQLNSHVPFSVAELLIAGAVIGLIVYIIYEVCTFKTRENKLRQVYIIAMTPVTAFLAIYALFCVLWGTYYYGDAPVKTEKVYRQQLISVTQYFADMAGEAYVDEPDRWEILARSGEINNGIGAKGIICSKVMSLIDFSGFYFPFTSEANVNLDMPAHDLASTCTHEIAHLNGIAREDEANFYAVKASLEFGDPDYVYSAALMAYTYLGNALYNESYDSWFAIYSSLSDEVKTDLSESNAYWNNYRTPIKEVSNTVYEGFLASYGETSGLKTYGECVDLLVNYYYPMIAMG